MFFLKHKTQRLGVDNPWDQKKWEYEEAIERCYKWDSVTLALNRSQKFVAFNVDYGLDSLLKDARVPFIDDAPEMYGVVHEPCKYVRHIQCEIHFTEKCRNEQEVGKLTLTHCSGWEQTTAKQVKQDSDLLLEVYLHDSNRELSSFLLNSLRDAAISGYSFMHVKLGCPKASDIEIENVKSKMCKDGYGTTRQISEIKLWPSIELENSPIWARQR